MACSASCFSQNLTQTPWDDETLSLAGEEAWNLILGLGQAVGEAPYWV